MLYYVALKAFANIPSAIKQNFYKKLTFEIVSSFQILILILSLTCKSCHEIHTVRGTSVKYKLHNCIGRLLMLFHTSFLTTARAKPWYYKRQACPLVSQLVLSEHQRNPHFKHEVFGKFSLILSSEMQIRKFLLKSEKEKKIYQFSLIFTGTIIFSFLEPGINSNICFEN